MNKHQQQQLEMIRKTIFYLILGSLINQSITTASTSSSYANVNATTTQTNQTDNHQVAKSSEPANDILFEPVGRTGSGHIQDDFSTENNNAAAVVDDDNSRPQLDDLMDDEGKSILDDLVEQFVAKNKELAVNTLQDEEEEDRLNAKEFITMMNSNQQLQHHQRRNLNLEMPANQSSQELISGPLFMKEPATNSNEQSNNETSPQPTVGEQVILRDHSSPAALMQRSSAAIVQAEPVATDLDDEDKHIHYDVIPAKLQPEMSPNVNGSSLEQENLDQSEQSATAQPPINQSAPLQSRSVQARSMGVNLPNLPTTLRTSHSRPPYATHDNLYSSLQTTTGDQQQQPIQLNKTNENPKSVHELMSSFGKITLHLNEDIVMREDAEDRKHLEKLSSIQQMVDLSPVNKHQQANKFYNNDKYLNLDHLAANKLLDPALNQANPLNKQQQLANSNQLSHRTGSPQPFMAASLVNVTAPMTLPLSATEAMESALLSEIEGLNKNKMRESMELPKQPAASSATSSTTGKPRLHYGINQYFTPNAGQLLNDLQASIYSPAANQFSPKPFFLESSGSGGGGEQSNATDLDKERKLTRRPSAAPSSLYQASGFRPPQQQETSLKPSSSSQSHQLINHWPLISGGYHLLNGLAHYQANDSLQSTTTAAPSQVRQNSSSSSLSLSLAHTTKSPGEVLQQPPQTSGGGGGSGSTPTPSTTNGFITSQQLGNSTSVVTSSVSQQEVASVANNVAGQVTQQQQQQPGKRLFNLTRVEHISAECSDELIRTVIVFNGTFKGIIYSSGYVRDPNCMYINGTGKMRYDFSIRLNQCGTLSRQEIHTPAGPNEAGGGGELRRRDQVMWNTLSIQYNPIIEQEWDEHFRVSCEYGSDFWKTISFSPFNVETNTGSLVLFTVDPPQCQMEILRGHGMVGPRQETVSGPVTVGDPLTLLIHMKSERAGYDILVKNCIAHNGGNQKMQLIDSNGCVVNERFISPFRGTYNDNDLKHVTLYSYLKAFRFTGSPVLYLECEIHMCQSACPPQMCYWRRLSKRSAAGNGTQFLKDHDDDDDDDEEEEELDFIEGDATQLIGVSKIALHDSKTGRRMPRTMAPSSGGGGGGAGKPLADKVSLFQALEVRQEREPVDEFSYSPPSREAPEGALALQRKDELMCYRRAEFLAFIITAFSLLFVAISVAIGCCWRAASLSRRHEKFKKVSLFNEAQSQPQSGSLCSPSSSSQYSTSSSGSGTASVAPIQPAIPSRVNRSIAIVGGSGQQQQQQHQQQHFDKESLISDQQHSNHPNLFQFRQTKTNANKQDKAINEPIMYHHHLHHHHRLKLDYPSRIGDSHNGN